MGGQLSKIKGLGKNIESRGFSYFYEIKLWVWMLIGGSSPNLFICLQNIMTNLGMHEYLTILKGGRRGRDHMVVGFTTTCAVQSVPITTKVVRSKIWIIG
jgi:hypothetical protein